MTIKRKLAVVLGIIIAMAAIIAIAVPRLRSDDEPVYYVTSETNGLYEEYEEVYAMSDTRPPGWELDLPSLAQAFESYFLFGSIYSSTSVMNQHNTREMFLHHFNAVTAENWHKPYNMAPRGFARPEASQYNFDLADAIVEWAIESGITLIGHVLVWHSQSPDWLNLSAPSVPLTRAEARANMEFHIRTLAEHFTAQGTIDAFHSWDVVNEAIASDGGSWGGRASDWDAGDWRTQMREDSPWFMAYANGYNPEAGEHPSDYVYDAFVFARRYFPNSILYYNDYNEEIPAKRNAIAQMVEQLNMRWAHDTENNPEAVPEGEEYSGRMLIEGIGMQGHYHLDQWRTNLDNIRPAIERLIATGAVISITELDITAGMQASPFAAPLDEFNRQRQAEAFGRLMGYYLEFHEHIERVTVWGKADHQSWRSWGHPLLFDTNYHAKEAFFAIIDAVNR
ncbi:MAG: endo-1,4-beta-xylanase [Defluviitaleaceae bacterium]|nr:endo-1,4-beta-xylanase [Defluviitaleaceae bacterium]